MAGNTSPIFVKAGRHDPLLIQNAGGTTFQALFVGGAEGSRVDALIATTDDTAANVLQFALQKGGVDYPIGEVDVPAGAGTSGTAVPTVNCLAFFSGWLDNRGCLIVPSGSTLRVRVKTAVTAAKNMYIQVPIGGDF